MTAAIEIQSLSKSYPAPFFGPAFQAVSDLSLRVSVGEVFGFIGPNGAGKSTTIKILTGVIRPTSGHAAIFGKDVSLPEARQGLGYVPENPALYEHLSPIELLEMAIAIHRIRTRNVRSHAMEWLDRLGLANVANKRIRSFSKGMVQRTALAHAMAVKPRLLILDEPLSGLDPVGRKEVVDILEEYRNVGGTIFLTSHVLHDVERLADRFGLINGGRMQSVQSPKDLAADNRVISVRSLGDIEPPGFRELRKGQWIGEVRRDELWKALDLLRQIGHSIVEIRPSLTLESVSSIMSNDAMKQG